MSEEIKDVVENKVDENKEPKVTMEDLMDKIAQLEATNTKLKKQYDQASSDASNFKKKYRDSLTAAEQAKIDKEEKDEEYLKYVKGLEDYVAMSKARERYTLQGMDAEMASKAAEAELSNDMDGLMKIQKLHTDTLIKKKQEEWLVNRPNANFGDGSGEEITQAQFDKMSIVEKSKLYRENKALYDRLNG